jgi:hypothetical protein
VINLYRARLCGAEGKIRLSWNEIKHRATKFAQDWKDAPTTKRARRRLSKTTLSKCSAFGARTVATFEEPVKRTGSKAPGFIDLFWKGTLLVEQKSAGAESNSEDGANGFSLDPLVVGC